MKPKPDETLEEIWAIRRQIAKRFGYDPKQQVAYYQRKQQDSGAKIYRPEVPAGSSLPAADVLHDEARVEVTTGQFAPPTSYRVVHKRKTKRAK